jgi:hypothetical protein
MQLPYVDEHAIRIAAPRDVVWDALQRYVERTLTGTNGSALTSLLGTQPPAGFGVERSEPPDRLSVTGRHRFARYELAFELADARGGATQLRAQTYAAFPGPHGRVYRALVIGTRAHVVATTRVLRAVRRLSVDPAR